ncbi:hypothetical protein LguiB_017590 [Lonicera macranthoides]
MMTIELINGKVISKVRGGSSQNVGYTLRNTSPTPPTVPSTPANVGFYPLNVGPTPSIVPSNLNLPDFLDYSKTRPLTIDLASHNQSKHANKLGNHGKTLYNFLTGSFSKFLMDYSKKCVKKKEAFMAPLQQDHPDVQESDIKSVLSAADEASTETIMQIHYSNVD